MDKVIEGDVARFEVPDLLALLNMGRRTGVLVMERPTQETKLFVRDGRPVYAATTREDLRIGGLLVRQKRLSANQLEQLLNRQRVGGHRIGQVLLSEKIVREEELSSMLKVQTSEIIFDTFGWDGGVFTFYDAVPPPATAVTLEIELPSLVMEGVRRIDVKERIGEIYPDLRMVVEALVNPERIKHSVALTKEEWQVFFLADGRRTLGEICRLAGSADEKATLVVIRYLQLAQLIAVVHGGPPEPTPQLEGLEPDATFRVIDERPAAAARAGTGGDNVSVEFGTAPRLRREDDTKEIVRPQAVRYMASATRLTVSRLVLVQAGQETSFPLTRDAHTLGRHRNNDIVINDPKVSSFHARIDRTPDGFVLVDLKSRNGSFVNAKRIENAVLKSGDEIRLGTARLAYRVDYTSAS